jgi:nicotinamidase-related amidase
MSKQVPLRFPAGSVQILVVDIQERLMAAMPQARPVILQVDRLLTAARALEIPILATEQYPRGLGPTIEPIARHLTAPPIPKMKFSALVPELLDILDRNRCVVLVGIETHVCLAQTAADLTAAGWQVILPVDAVTARSVPDHETAIKRMRQFGTIVTTSEALLFEWLETAEHPQFKMISKLVKEFDPGSTSV